MSFNNNFIQPSQFNYPYGNYSLPNFSMIAGRVITNSNDMRPQDVPMDGSWAVFPETGMQNIYLKYWDKNCNLQTIRYIREQVDEEVVEAEPEKEAVSASDISDILSRLSSIEDDVAKLSKAKTPATKATSSKEAKDSKEKEVA